MTTLVDPGPTSPLNDPSHSALHASTNSAIAAVDSRVGALEGRLPGIEAGVNESRREVVRWVVTGPLSAATPLVLVPPVIWNLSSRAWEFEAVKASVLGAPAVTDVWVDIVTGAAVTGGIVDPATQSSILTGSKLVIPAGAYESVVSTSFTTNLSPNSFVVAVVTSVGDAAAPGSDLTLQLNMLI